MSEVNKSIENWINKSGFPLEMKVANAFIKAGFDVAQSVYYFDTESEKYRETDIIATLPKLIKGVSVNLTFVIECKVTNDKPWIVLINAGIKNYSDDLPIYITKNGLKFIESLKGNVEFKSDLLYKNTRPIGYSIITAFNKDGKEPSFDAIQSLTKACEHFLKECNEKRNYQINIYFPTIVIDGLLYKASLIKNEEMKIEEVKNAEVSITRSFHTFGNANLLIFNSSNIDKIAVNLYLQGEELFKKYDKFLKNNINSV
jgi:hypothetical protein